jgi:outer membrane protein TolC
MRYTFMAICWIFCAGPAQSQDRTLTLEACFGLASRNYPLIKQKELIRLTRDYSVANASKGYLPQFTISGQATYQSQTLAFPFKVPGLVFPTYSKDQYKAMAEIDQTIYDGGAIKYQKALTQAQENAQLQGMEVDLYAIRDRVSQLFFGILLFDAQIKQNAIREEDFQNEAGKTQASVDNGTSLRSNLDELKAEILITEQARTELLASRKAFADMLSLFIGQPIDPATPLVKPVPFTISSQISRPELGLFESQKKSFEIQEQQLRSNYLPRIGAFVQGAYSRPTLNFISNDFGFWALGGIRLNWSLSSLYTLKNDKKLLALSRQNIDVQKETFLFNTNLTLTQQTEEANKYQTLLNQDQKIIDLRIAVKEAAAAQLENGVITTHDFIAQVNAENQARQGLILHEIQFLQSLYNTKTTTGN